jgi:ATP-binding cassette subfamily B protein
MANDGVRLYVRLLREARPYWAAIAGLLALQLLATPLKLLMPVPLKIVVDNVLGGQPPPALLTNGLPSSLTGSPTRLLAFAVALLVTVTLAAYLQSLALWMAQTYTGERLVLSFRAKLFDHVQRLSLSYLDKRGSSDSTYRIQYDAVAIKKVAVGGVIPFVTACVTVLGFIAAIAVLDRQLAVVSLAVVPPLFILTRMCGKRLRSEWKTVKRMESSAMSVIQETLGSLRVVKAFGQQSRQRRQFLDHSRRSLQRQWSVSSTQGGFDLVIGTTTACGAAVVLFLGALHVRDGTLSLGNLLMVMTYLAQLYAPLELMSRRTAELQSGLAGAERAFSLLDERPEVIERPNPVPIERARGDIRFESVHFDYGAGAAVLRDVSVTLPAGTCVGITGRTGAGKSTMISLLMRFYDPTCGRILLDRKDVTDYELRGLRNQFAVVLQDPVLFSTSIAENIAYADPDANMSAIIAAARAANAHEFIDALPDGYETQVGERGMLLSSGERQRISLARAFLKDAPILILDEPTSSVDIKTESSIMQSIERLMRGRTCLLITHRLDALRWCDVQWNLQDGHVRVVPLDKSRAKLGVARSRGITRGH